MTALPVNELFETIQGEGSRVGVPSVFLRLQGCPVGCPWCDTRYTWETDPALRIEAGELMTKDRGEATWAMMSETEILALIERCRANHVVITGGEPAQYDLSLLTAALIDQLGRTVQIETSGTYPLRCHCSTWVTVSPKLDMPGGLSVLEEAIARADEIKMPIGKQSDIVTLIELLSRGWHRPETAVLVQPLSLSRRATDICVENAIANNWRVSLQVHQLAGWR